MHQQSIHPKIVEIEFYIVELKVLRAEAFRRAFLEGVRAEESKRNLSKWLPGAGSQSRAFSERAGKNP